MAPSAPGLPAIVYFQIKKGIELMKTKTKLGSEEVCVFNEKSGQCVYLSQKDGSTVIVLGKLSIVIDAEGNVEIAGGQVHLES